jgi:hypothetical protein
MNALARAWAFARRPRNLALIIALGGALGFVVQLVVERHDSKKPDAESATQGASMAAPKPAMAQTAPPPAPAGPVSFSATADHGSVATTTVGDGAQTQVNGGGQKK